MNSRHLFWLILVLSYIDSYGSCGRVEEASKQFDSDEAVFEKFRQDFRELESLLCERTSSSNPEINMELIEKLLAKPGPLNFVGLKIKHRLEDAEKLFLSMKHIPDKRFCNRMGFKIISDNARALLSVHPFPRRMGGIFSDYAKQHHTICSRLYPAMVAERLAKMDKDKLNRLEFVVSKLMNSYPGSGTEVEELFSLVKYDKVGPNPQRLEKLFVDLIKTMPANEITDKGLKPEDSNREMFKMAAKKYLIEPCEHYIENLADDIFDPATALIHHHAPNVLETQFYRSWARYKFCVNAYNQILTNQ